MQPTTGGTYTSPYGSTAQGNQVNDLVNLLASAQNMSPQQAQNVNVTAQQASQPQAQAMQMQANEPSYLTSEQQNLTQQAGIPQLQGQQQNLGQVFQMWLADQNLAQKYQGGQLNTPNSPIFNNPNLVPQGVVGSNVIGGSNPYLSSPQSLVQAVTQPSGQGFQGFTDPNLITGAMGEVPQASTNMMNLLQSAIGSQTGLVNQQLGNAQTQYEGRTNMLSNIANLLGGIYQNKMQLAQANAANPSAVGGSMAQAGSIFDQIVTQVQSQKAGNATERDVWDYINQHAQALRDQGVNVNELWKLHKQMAQKVGTGGLIAGGTKAASSASQTAKTKQQQLQESRLDSVRGFGDILNEYGKSTINLGGINIINPLSKEAGQFEAGKKVYLSALIKAFGASKGKYIYDQFQQSVPGEVSSSNRAEGQLSGHLQSLLQNNDMVIAKNNKSGTVTIKFRNQLKPGDVVTPATDYSTTDLYQMISEL